jgi:hypothetical protein
MDSMDLCWAAVILMEDKGEEVEETNPLRELLGTVDKGDIRQEVEEGAVTHLLVPQGKVEMEETVL